MTTAARLISPFYPLLLPLLLVAAAHGEIIRRRWWRWLVWGNIVFAFAVLVLTPPRPLWPAKTILSKARALKPEQRLLARAEKVYSVYGERSDPLAGVRTLLPPATTVIGFVATADDIDLSLWRPYGATRVEHILLTDSPAKIRERGIQSAAIGGVVFEQNNTTLADWLEQFGAELIGTTNATMKVAEGPRPWHVVRFKETSRKLETSR